MTTEEIIAIIARAMYSNDFDGKSITFSETRFHTRYRAKATAVLAALRDAGMVIVPLNPSPAMKSAAAKVLQSAGVGAAYDFAHEALNAAITAGLEE